MEKAQRALVDQTETLPDFKRSRQLDSNIITNQNTQFGFFTSDQCKSNVVPYRRRDFFKVGFLRGDYVVHYGDESIGVDGASLSIFNPNVPYTIETLLEDYHAGYFIFSELFYDDYYKQPISQFPLFDGAYKTVYRLDKNQEEFVRDLFLKIEAHASDTYGGKYALIRNAISELLHFACRLNPVSERVHSFNSQERLVNVFIELLERQFPADSGTKSGMIRRASDFAAALSVHVNYLNRAVKNITGKSTTRYICERYLKESIILLRHTSYSISEIAYSLGFSDASHFNHFFKSMTAAKPSDYRKAI